MTDVEEAKCKVLPKIADHELVLCYFDLPVPETEKCDREVWKYGKADWDAVRTELSLVDWDKLELGSTDQAAETLSHEILRAAYKYIPRKNLCKKKSTHPWIDDKVMELVRAKQAGAGTSEAKEAMEACSVGIKEEYLKYVEAEKVKLRQESKATRGWWSRTRRLYVNVGEFAAFQL